jgi:small nuclear ribonucleoprotein B and B'
MRTSKIGQLLNSRVKVTLQDGRVFIGQLLAHDKHLNFVLADCEEFRLLKRGNGDSERRNLGLIVLRGEEIVSVSQETGAPPRGGNKARIPASNSSNSAAANTARVGIPPPGSAPVGLAGPMPGMFIRPGM